MEDLNKKIKLFENRQIRASWDENAEKWWFSVVDIVAILTESENPQVYWRVLKKRLADEGNETVTNCNGLKMLAPDGKMQNKIKQTWKSNYYGNPEFSLQRKS